MPTHADRIRRNYNDAGPHQDPPVTQPLEALTRPLSELERYSGWLARGHVSVAIRADVRTLVEAIDFGNDTSLLLLTLDRNIARLPGGDIRKMLRKALGEVRAVLRPVGIDTRQGEGS